MVIVLPSYQILINNVKAEDNDNPDNFEPSHIPTLHVMKFIAILKTKEKSERIYYRALSNYNDKSISIQSKPIVDWTINQAHLQPDVTITRESYPNLLIIDIRDYGWSPAAFSAVARREPYFREPFIDSRNAILLRELLELDQDPDTLHLEGIVRADWFVREIMELDRSPTYHDLLFSKFRFIYNDDNYIKPTDVTVPLNQKGTPGTKEVIEEWSGGVDPIDGKYYPPGKYTKIVKVAPDKNTTNKGFKFVDFPKTEKEFERVFGVDKVFDFIKESGINPQKGAVVEGGEKGVSIVARQNRLIAFTRTPFGIYAKTFDVKATTGNRDFTETLQKNFEYDAGEILTDLPGGGIAAALVNRQGTILTTADNRFATDKSDITFDARVRTPGSCYICHEAGYIKPQNIIEDMLNKGVDIKFKNKQDQIDAKAFFLNWGDQFDSWQIPHKKLATRLFGNEVGPRATAVKAYRDAYDQEITLEKAISEYNIPREQFIAAAAQSTKARILNLIVGISMPRKTWEVDGFKEMVLQLNKGKKANHKP